MGFHSNRSKNLDTVDRLVGHAEHGIDGIHRSGCARFDYVAVVVWILFGLANVKPVVADTTDNREPVVE